MSPGAKRHAEEATRYTLQDLKIEQLDLLLLHWPVAFLHEPFKRHESGRGW